MNKLILFLKSTAGKIILLMLLLAISFYGGMEYKAYQIRSALKDAISGLSDVFGGNSKTSNKVAESNSSSEPKISNELNGKVGFEITKKTFSAGDFFSQINFTVQLTNNTDKDMEGVEGMINFNDIFGNSIKQVQLSYDEGIKAGETKLYSAGIDYNKFMDSDVKLKSTDLSKIKYDWQVNKIVYTDGSAEY